MFEIDDIEAQLAKMDSGNLESSEEDEKPSESIESEHQEKEDEEAFRGFLVVRSDIIPSQKLESSRCLASQNETKKITKIAEMAGEIRQKGQK